RPSVWVTRKEKAEDVIPKENSLQFDADADSTQRIVSFVFVRRGEQPQGVYVKKLRVGVIYGGRSGEHEVSLASAAAVFANLDPTRYEAVPIRIEKDGRWMLPDRPPSLVSAADVIQARGNELAETALEAHVVARPGGDVLLTIDRR